MSEEKPPTELERVEQSHAQVLLRMLRGERLLVATIMISAFGLAAFAMWLIAQRRRDEPQLGLFGLQPQMQMQAFPQPSAPLQLVAPPPVKAPMQPQPPMQTAMLTMTLPHDRVQRLWQPPMPHGPTRYWRVTVRNIGPAGSFAIISMDSGLSPINSIQIPAGMAGSNDFHMSSSQILFGQASVAGVEITLAASAA